MVYMRTLWYLTLCSPYSYVFNSCKAIRLTRNIHNNSTSKYSTNTEGPPWRIIFFGTDNFALTCIQPICAKLRTGTLISDLGVVSGSGSIVRKFAKNENLTVHDWPFDHEIIKDKYDLGIIVSFGHLIPERIINTLPLGIINVHGSLLPRWRGAAPVVYAVKNGDSETGVTIMRIKPKRFDTGDIVRQYRCSIAPNEMAKDLTDKLAKHGAQLIMECLRDLPRCLDMAIPQAKEGITLAPRVNASLAAINWTTMDTKTVYNLHRAISHLYPLTCYWHGTQLRLLDVKPDKDIKTSPIEDKDKEIVPGRVRWNPKIKILTIQCVDGNYISCSGLALAGKKQMSPTDFYNGYLSKRKENEWVLTIR